MKDNLELKCKGEFPVWGHEQNIGGILWKPEEICKECIFLQACVMKRSSEILFGETLPQKVFEFIGQLSQLQKEKS